MAATMSDRRRSLREALCFAIEVEQFEFGLNVLTLFVPRDVRKLTPSAAADELIFMYARECYPEVRSIRLVAGLWGVRAWNFYLGGWHAVPRYSGSKVAPELPAGRTRFRGPWR